MEPFELDVWNGKYILSDLDKSGHFMIDCLCGESKGFSLPNSDSLREQAMLNYYEARNGNGKKHLFYSSHLSLFLDLNKNHSKNKNQEPLTIVCKNCSNSFDIFYEDYSSLVAKATLQSRTNDLANEVLRELESEEI